MTKSVKKREIEKKYEVRRLSEPSNEDRASWAEHALRAFAQITGIQQEDEYTRMADLIADLRHLADDFDLDWNEVIQRAYGNYEEEVEEEQDADHRAAPPKTEKKLESTLEDIVLSMAPTARKFREEQPGVYKQNWDGLQQVLPPDAHVPLLMSSVLEDMCRTPELAGRLLYIAYRDLRRAG